MNVRVGAGVGAGLTITVAVALALPPAPVQVRVKLLVVERLPVLAVPEVPRAPLQAPDAVHDVALVDDQLKFELLPALICVGLAVIDTVGAGVLLCTLTVTLFDAVPPRPTQFRVKDVAELMAFVVNVPSTG